LLQDERSPSFREEGKADNLFGMQGEQQNETQERDERQKPQFEILTAPAEPVECPKVFRDGHNR
jgi:hypothetical protein